MELTRGAGPQQNETSRLEFWRAHIERAEKFEGSKRQYCEQEGLSHTSFYQYRKKLGLGEAKSPKLAPPGAFAAVHVEKPDTFAQSQQALPDPKWLAEFLRAWSQV